MVVGVAEPWGEEALVELLAALESLLSPFGVDQALGWPLAFQLQTLAVCPPLLEPEQ